MAKRLKDWPSRLEAVVRAARTRPFAWGEHDCCLWAADAVAACTGEDPAAKWRGTYSDAAGAMRLVEELGGLAAIGALGGRTMRPAFATAGDVGLLRHADGREVLAVYSGQEWLAVTAKGLHPCADSAVLQAWKVGG